MKNNYQIVRTDDGSLSLIYSSKQGRSEAMHHSGGAVEESLYIYLPAATWALEKTGALRALSIGLGTGINEFIMASECVKQNLPLKQVCIESYESEKWLTDSLTHWLTKSSESNELFDLYKQNLNKVCEQQKVSAYKVKGYLQDLFQNKHLVLNKALSESTDFESPFNCILYDFFSSKLDANFWQPEFINSFLKKASAQTCSFASYASTGALKRALKANNFVITKKSGFCGKRESTFSYKLNPTQIENSGHT